jgi:uroporphyrinogen III methyltransferase/synthase
MQTTTHKPLSGLRILVTRPEEQARALSGRLSRLGAATIQVPTIKILPTEDNEAFDKAVTGVTSYDWVIFTSVHGVHFFTERMQALKVPREIIENVRVAAIGPSTATALELAIKKPDYVPKQYLSEKILEGLGDVNGKRVLLPRADIASKTLPAALRARGALVDELTAYRTVVPPELTSERLNSILAGGLDLVTFTSPSTVRNLAEIVGHRELASLLGRVKVACIGPVTEKAANELGIAVDIVAKAHTIDALVEAIVDEI